MKEKRKEKRRKEKKTTRTIAQLPDLP